jgi:hypothetical protein
MINGLLLVMLFFVCNFNCVVLAEVAVLALRRANFWLDHCIGGSKDLWHSRSTLLSVERYQPERNEWFINDIPNLSCRHWGGASVSLMNQMIVVSGGEVDNVEAYDPRTDQKKWIQLKRMPNEGRRHFSMITLNDYQALVIGGFSNTMTTTSHSNAVSLSLPIYELDIRATGGHQWITHDGSTLSNGGFPPLPYTMYSPSVALFDDTLVVIHTLDMPSGIEWQYREFNSGVILPRLGHYLPCHPSTSRPLISSPPSSRSSSSSSLWQTFELPPGFQSSGLSAQPGI